MASKKENTVIEGTISISADRLIRAINHRELLEFKISECAVLWCCPELQQRLHPFYTEKRNAWTMIIVVEHGAASRVSRVQATLGDTLTEYTGVCSDCGSEKHMACPALKCDGNGIVVKWRALLSK